MRAARGAGAGAALAMLLLAGCGGGEPQLMNLRSTGPGPDEFGIMPVKPLEIPETIAALPAPTPGGANLADPNPLGDAVAALGGNRPGPGRSLPPTRRSFPMRPGSAAMQASARRWPPRIMPGGATTTGASSSGCST